MNQTQLEIVGRALALYGAELTPEGFIRRGEKTTSVRVVVTRGRFSFESSEGISVGSGPITDSTVCQFVERFWFWKPTSIFELGAPTCPNCNKDLGASTATSGSATPSPGQAAICGYCARILIYTHELSLREPTPKELEQLQARPEIRQALGIVEKILREIKK